MKRRIFALFLFGFSLASISHAAEKLADRSDWANIFNKFDAQGTIVVADERAASASLIENIQILQAKVLLPTLRNSR